jgi:hypothetical protein
MLIGPQQDLIDPQIWGGMNVPHTSVFAEQLS